MGPDDLVFSCAPFLDVPLFDRLAPVAAAGFAGITTSPRDLWALEAAGVSAREVAARIADAGLQLAEMDCVACWMDHHRAGGDDLSRLLASLTPEAVIKAAAALGSPSVAVIDLSPQPAPIDRAAEAFARVCDLAADHGIAAHIEFLPVGGILSLGHALDIIAAAGRPNAGITLDVWHFRRSGGTLADLAAVPPGLIRSVQLCDVAPVPLPDPWEELMTARLLPGEGVADCAAIVATLDQIGSRAPMGVEVFHPNQAALGIAKTARAWADAARATLLKARTRS